MAAVIQKLGKETLTLEYTPGSGVMLSNDLHKIKIKGIRKQTAVMSE